MGILPLMKGYAESIYSTLIDRLKKEYVQCHKLLAWDFFGAATFEGKNLVGMGFCCATTVAENISVVQAQLKKNTPYSIFIYCHCHMLQLAIVQATGDHACLLYIHHLLEVLLSYPKKALRRYRKYLPSLS